MNVVVAAKLRKGEWRGAVIVDNEFEDSMIHKSLYELVTEAIGDALLAGYAEGQDVTVTLVVKPNAAKAQDFPS